MKQLNRKILCLIPLVALLSCGGDPIKMPSIRAYRPIPASPHGRIALMRNPDLAKKILALDPNNISDADVRETLSKGPTPWMLSIAPLSPWSEEFLAMPRFLVEMGYPIDRIGDPRKEEYKVFWKEKPEIIAGMAAWLYELDGMNPLMMGWSGGGILTVVVLHSLNNTTGKSRVQVVNGRTGVVEDRAWIIDPYTKKKRPITSLRFSFAASLAAGGLGRVVQAEIWEIVEGLRQIPDSAEEFLGFQSPWDSLGTDAIDSTSEKFLKENTYRPLGKAEVRSIIADYSYDHFKVVHCEFLSANEEGRKWANSYKPNSSNGLWDMRKSDEFSLIVGKQNIWCGEIWYRIKKHWALQAQRVARFVLKEVRRQDGQRVQGVNKGKMVLR